jgi:hypothetical protein
MPCPRRDLLDEAAERRQPEGVCEAVRHPAFTRFNVFLRDRFQCQYCGTPEDLTFDHVIPAIVAVQRPGRMSSPTLPAISEGRLMPAHAKMWPLQNPISRRCMTCIIMAACSAHHLHESWMDYLYWDVELEP